MSYTEILEEVIAGIKAGVPISKTLKKKGYHRTKFYNLCDESTKRYLNELKCLKTADRTHSKYSRNDYFGNYNIL